MSKNTKSIDDIIIYTDICLKVDDVPITIKNMPLELLGNINRETIINIFQKPWYMYGCYDKVELFGINFILIEITRKKITLLRANE